MKFHITAEQSDEQIREVYAAVNKLAVATSPVGRHTIRLSKTCGTGYNIIWGAFRAQVENGKVIGWNRFETDRRLAPLKKKLGLTAPAFTLKDSRPGNEETEYYF